MPLVLLLCPQADAEQPYPMEWKVATGMYQSTGVIIDASGNIFTSGYQCDTPACRTRSEAYLSKFDRSGTEIWRQFLSSGEPDFGLDVALNDQGHAYLTGYTHGSLVGQSDGGYDAVLASIDSQGIVRWARQWGTSDDEQGNAIAVDKSGNAFIAGYTGTTVGGYDATLTKFDPAGRVLWSTQVSQVRYEVANDVSVDSQGNVYIAGWSSVGAFLTKFDREGNALWNKSFGTDSGTRLRAIAIDLNDQIYVAGSTGEAIAGVHLGSVDGFIYKFDGLGTQLWSIQNGSQGAESNWALAVDLNGNLFVAGSRNDHPQFYTDFTDLTLTKYSSAGREIWTETIESPKLDFPTSVAADSIGNIYLTGYTEGYLVPVTRNVFPAGFLIKFQTNVPEPSTLLLVVPFAVYTLVRRMPL
jgi:hypothetical protein